MGYLVKFCCCLLLTAHFGAISAKHSKQQLPSSNEDSEESGEWRYRWFPHNPNESPPPAIPREEQEQPKKLKCDDGENFLAVDFDPKDKRHAYNYLCYMHFEKYAPDLNREAILYEDFIPPMFVPQVKCLNESIEYVEAVPTYGSFRPLAAAFGSYLFLPPQRYVHNLAQGAIVMLYHPCSNHAQRTLLRNTLRGCLYRHIITPSISLTPEHPLALLAWGKSLLMSVVDTQAVVEFIKTNAKQGPLANFDISNTMTKTYKAGLLEEARLVTDINDNEICGYHEM